MSAHREMAMTFTRVGAAAIFARRASAGCAAAQAPPPKVEYGVVAAVKRVDVAA